LFARTAIYLNGAEQPARLQLDDRTLLTAEAIGFHEGQPAAPAATRPGLRP
jgi:hypothetical protein